MLAFIARIDTKEAVWRWLMEQADERERTKLNAMTIDDRRRLIEATREHHADWFTKRGQ